MPDKVVLAAACLVCWPCWGQAASGPSQATLEDAVRLGTVPPLAPPCGLRDDAWSFGLRRAAVMDATHAPQPDDETLRRVPGRDLAVAALSHAEAEALEAFAETPASNTCGSLADDPELVRADRIAQGRREAGQLMPSHAQRRRTESAANAGRGPVRPVPARKGSPSPTA